MGSRKSAMAVACDRKGGRAGVAGFLFLAFLVAVPIILEILKLNLLLTQTVCNSPLVLPLPSNCTACSSGYNARGEPTSPGKYKYCILFLTTTASWKRAMPSESINTFTGIRLLPVRCPNKADIQIHCCSRASLLPLV